MLLSAIVKPPRWSAGTAQSTGWACHASTPRHASRLCSADTKTAAGRLHHCPLPSRSPAAISKAVLSWRRSLRPLKVASLLVDCMGRRDAGTDLVRLVRGLRGRTRMRMELTIRFEYGSVIPWVRRLDDGRLTAVAGPDRLTLATPAAVHGEGMSTVAEFEVGEGEEIPFSLTWSPSFRA